MPRTLADGRLRLFAMTVKPVNPAAVKVTEVTAGKNIACAVLKADYRLSATDDDAVGEATICDTGNATLPGNSNYEGKLTVVRYINETTGLADASPADDAWTLFGTKGARLWVWESEGKLQTSVPATGDPYDMYEVVCATAKKPSDRTGYIKREITLHVQQAWESKFLVT